MPPSAAASGRFSHAQIHQHKTRKEPFRTLLLAIVTFHLGLIIATAATSPELSALLDAWAAVP
ncbi:hypothetical protein NGR_c10990 [Sinorhizobium fredii NGR234]|uniref:Uncharacterized protein n=1 Tax=Sinorhizobium fredii (strain NBRC 101917 / NGR234) TaxID=394 RepID=C3MAA6_SINFN|nr:hypothetical protein NGR_c10990 [Sinorhizobium fredii NGR234]